MLATRGLRSGWARSTGSNASAGASCSRRKLHPRTGLRFPGSNASAGASCSRQGRFSGFDRARARSNASAGASCSRPNVRSAGGTTGGKEQCQRGGFVLATECALGRRYHWWQGAMPARGLRARDADQARRRAHAGHGGAMPARGLRARDANLIVGLVAPRPGSNASAGASCSRRRCWCIGHSSDVGAMPARGLRARDALRSID